MSVWQDLESIKRVATQESYEAARIRAIEDDEERVQAMLDSPYFDDDEVIEEIYTSGSRDSHWRVKMVNRYPELFGFELSEPEAPDTRSVEEVHGGPVSVSYTSATGTTITRQASREEADKLRREEILDIADVNERMEAIARNIDLFK